MLNRLLPFFVFIFLSLLLILMVHSCANIAAPMGGEYDVDPPVVVGSSPQFNALNVSPQRVEIEFDENIKIESPTEKVIITPPQTIMPVIRSIGRRAVVELKDDLLPNTTYTIDFTDAIVDNNEGNPLENFMFSFATGDQLDTLSIAGKVLNAEDLEPVTGIYVGIHSNFDDTVFTNVPFERISRTDSRGNFIVRGMAPGKYRVFALNDLNRDYKYDNPLEAIAFLDSIVIPSTLPAVRQDTVFVDSVTVDTILEVKYTRFIPDDLVLNSFLSDFQRLYLLRHERPLDNRLNIFFSAPTEEPFFSLVEPIVDGDDWYIAERNLNNDTLMLWITDSLVYQHDSIRMQISYMETDTLNRNVITNDTLNFNFRRTPQEKVAESKKEKEDDDESEPQDILFLSIKSNVQSTFELYNPIRIELEQPALEFNSSFLKLEIEEDSLFKTVPFKFETDSINPRKFVIRPTWEPGGKYKISIDSAAITSIYGIWNNTFEQAFTVKALDQYGNLQISISGLPEGKFAFVELLNNSDKPFRKSHVKGNIVRFQDLPPGEVYARLIIDDNEDGLWTTGSYDELRQPEKVYYYPGKFVIRAYSDHLEEWSLLAVPEIKQKPLEITINKPQEKKRLNPNEERERQRQQQNRQGSPMQSLGGGLGGLR